MRNKRGVALVVVLGFLLILSILAGVILLLGRGHYETTGIQMKRAKAFYLAEAGIQHALWRIRTGDIILPRPPSGTFTFTHPVTTPEGDVDVRIRISDHPDGDPPLGVDWDITATVRLDEVGL